MTNKVIGKQGEEIAKNFLIKHGFEILETNFRYSKMAEIDIIAQKNNIIHFIEVKTRTQKFFGAPFEAITPKKLQSIYLCSRYYLSNCKKRFSKIQIDAIGIVLDKNNKADINFLENISL